MEKKLAGWAASSVDPNQLSKTIESGLKVIGGVLVLFGVLTNEDLTALLGQVGTAVPAIYVIWNVAEFVFGILRKAFVKVATR